MSNFGRKGLRVSAFTQMLDGDADNLLTRDPAGNPIAFAFNTNTTDRGYRQRSDACEAARRQLRREPALQQVRSVTRPNSDNRTELGLYGQDEIFLSDHFRLTAGGRVDRFDYLDSFVFSPRIALLIKPVQNHTFRVSYNRAYRSPSVINNFLDVTIAEPLTLAPSAGAIRCRCARSVIRT